jgi:uncharacterized protein YybS (DUF2232 family)
MTEQGPVSAPAPARVAVKAESRPHGVVAAGLVSAFLFSVSLVLPLLFAAALVSPFPLLLQRLRGGLGAAALATFVAAGALAAAFSPAQAVLFLLFLAIPCLMIAESLARGRGLLRGCGWAFVLVSLQISLALVFRSGPMATRLLAPLDAIGSPQFQEDMKATGVPAESIQAWKEQATSLRSVMAVVFPGVYIVMGGLVVLANAALLRFYLARRDPGWLEGGEFERIRWSPLLAMTFVVAGAAVAVADLRPAAYNVLLVLAFFFMLQGLAVIAFYAHRLNVPPPLRAAVVVLVLINPWAPQILALLGLFDTWIDFRKYAEPSEARKE